MLKGKGLLSTGQRRFLRLFSKMPDSTHFYLTGGTALAEFYLGHRYSFDLDLFRGEPRGARGFGSPCLQGNLKEGVIGHTHFCELWLRDWYNFAWRLDSEECPIVPKGVLMQRQVNFRSRRSPPQRECRVIPEKHSIVYAATSGRPIGTVRRSPSGLKKPVGPTVDARTTHRRVSMARSTQ